MEELNLFPEEDTLIRCKLPGGEKLEIDAFDLDTMVAKLVINEQAEDNKVPLGLVIDTFEKEYGIRINKMSAHILMVKKDEILDRVKKNSYPMSEPVSSTESNQDANETSKSSDLQKA